MSIRDWPEAERPRERLLAHGPGSLSDGELLAIFLRTGVAGHSAVDVARNLLIRFGGLRALLEADQKTFSQHFGMGPAKYAQLQASIEMNRRYMAERLNRGPAMEDPSSVRHYLKAKLRHERQEVFGCLFLTPSISRWVSKYCFAAPSTARRCIRVRWSNGPSPQMRQRSSWRTIILPEIRPRARPIAR